MWLLVIMLLNPAPGFSAITILKEFGTYQACQSERRRIGFAMAEAYPYERDFEIKCIPRVAV